MTSDLLLYGYDARQPLDAVDSRWSAERRERYLLRTDTRRPASVDRTVWPPAECANITDGFATDYWADLGLLRRACVGKHEQPAALIALAVHSSSAAEPLFPAAEPSGLSPLSRPLGYDVADSGLISALSNCGWVPGRDDVEAMRRRFGPRLNNYGLFDHLADADEFRRFSDGRVPEHSPFFVHQILLLPWEGSA